MASSSSAEVSLGNGNAGAGLGVEDAREPDAQQSAVSILQRFAVFAMTFGPGSAVATYTSLFGWYQEEYHTREIIVWMRLALFAPFPVMKLMQQRYDTYFDEMYSTESMYLFRIVVMQVVVSLMMIIWMLLPLSVSATVHPVLIFGVLLGACCSPFIGSSIQIAVAIDPGLFVWAQLGNTLGSTVPVLAAFALRFSPSSSHADLCRLLAVPLSICILTSAALGSLHYSGVFNPAYSTITRRRSEAALQVPQATANPQDDEGDASAMDDRLLGPTPTGAAASEETGSRGGVQVDAELSDDLQEFPLWVRIWLGMQSFGIALDFFLLTLMGYFGDADTTHDLAAGTLASAAAGRLLSLPARYLPAFDKGPMHLATAMLFFLRVGLWLLLIFHLGKVLHIPYQSLVPLWCVWIFFGMMHNSLTDMTVTSHVSEGKRQVVAQLSVAMAYSALFIGLLTASSLVLVEGDELNGSVSVAFLQFW